VPLYNEAGVIRDVIAELRQTYPLVVCVDDGSTDGSAALAEQAGARVVRHPVNLGQGAALQTGISYALTRADVRFLVTFDADGQHRVDDVGGMLALAREKNLAIVFGSRFLDKRTRAGWAKRMVLRAAVWITNKSTGLRLSDAHNGLRVIRSDAAQRINLKQDRMAHATEIVLQLSRTRLPWAEYPVHLLYTDYSKAKGQSLMNSVNILVDLLIR
jgi:glycosyltransferase involved in cell wall biosynthesis